MHLEKYTIVKGGSDFHYEFYSEGPKGRIKKVVRFVSLTEYENDYYNLYLGDWLEAEDRFSDTVISNNRDREKILATVAAIVVHFTAAIPHAVIFAEGSTASRTRLYQMGISANWQIIKEYFDLQGFKEGEWERFQKNRNYEAFLLRRK
ncbi:MAG TPA: hypothetical protein VFE32_20375 [Puia sp.]|jgi:hypothetical protein|nr:hypothetical protein [Puia sp.]